MNSHQYARLYVSTHELNINRKGKKINIHRIINDTLGIDAVLNIIYSSYLKFYESQV